MSKTFRQYDSRWGKKKYPSGSSCTMSGSGCGPTACADIIVNNPKHKSKTPANTRSFMCKNSYAIAGQGTAWDGIDACLKYYGFKVTRHTDMESFFKEMAKGNRYAIILFRGGTKGGVTWTTGGHYLAATDYKVKSGKHYLYMRDPGLRRHDGWYCYETKMKGLIKVLWTCYLPATTSKATTKTTTTAKTTTKTTTTYKVGKTYTLQGNMNVRTGAGTIYKIKKVSQLTESGKKCATSKKSAANAVLKKGTKVTCKKVKKVGKTTWMQIPSGWICAKTANNTWVK